MCNKELGADLVMAWPTAQIAVMGASGAVNIISSVKKEIKNAEDPDAVRAAAIEDYEEKFNNPYVAAGLGYVDDVIEPATTRQRRHQRTGYVKHEERIPAGLGTTVTFHCRR